MALITVYASKDATAREGDDSWNGWDNHLPVGQSPAGNRYRSFIYFPLSFTGITTITNAKLFLRATRQAGGTAGVDYHVLGDASGNTRQLEVRRVTSDFGEGTDRGEGVWSNAEFWGWSNRATEISTVNISLTTFTGYTHGDWYEIDVTGIVNDWKDGSPNYGLALMIRDYDTVDSKALEFFSRHQGSGFKPYLEITHGANVAPNAPTNLTPTSNALVNTLMPTLTGQRSDPDAGDYITAYQIKVWEDDTTTLKWDSGTILQSGTSSIFSKVYAGPALIGNRFYRWQARTRDKAGAWGPFIATLQRFKTNTPPNAPTVSITQNPDSDLLTLTPTMNITHSDNDIGDSKMYGYRAIITTAAGVQLWDSGDIDTSGTPVTTKTFTYAGPALAWQTSYNFKARTKDINGVWGAYSANLPFTTHTTGVPIALDPSSETISSLIPVFEGARATVNDTITSYQIILYAADGVTLIWDSGALTTSIASGSSFSKSYTGTALALATTYKWKARATGSIGGTSPYSTLQTFTTPADATVPALSITPQTSGRVTSLTPTFGGSRAAAFTHYQVQVYPATATSTTLGTPLWDSGDTTQASATTFSKLYAGPALAWGTTYKWRARVGAPALGSYTGLTPFTTDTAGVPTLNLPADSAWLTSVATNFTGTAAAGESITSYQVAIWNTAGTTIMYDSGFVSQTAASTFSRSIDLSALASGVTYKWSARYTKSTGPTGPWAGFRNFRLNGAPSIPTSLYPTPGHAFPDTLYPTFRAEFVDPDETTEGDEPTVWEIEIRNNASNSLIQSKTLGTPLNNAVNEYVWGTNTGSVDSGLAFNTIYKWRTRFTDLKGVAGAWSSYSTFYLAEPPVISVLTPSNGSNISTVRPVIEWVFTDPAGLAMGKFTVTIYRDVTGTKVYSLTNNVSSVPYLQVPSSYLQKNGEFYTIHVIAYNTAGIVSNELTSTVQLTLDAPPAIEGMSATVYEEKSLIRLDWDRSSLGAAFVAYVIYRRRVGETEWSAIGIRKPEVNNFFNDWYAGQGVPYEYRVTVVKLITNEPDVESPDSDIVSAILESDVWMIVGRDRAEEHIFELEVSSESHSRPVQQETFEPLGSNRKAVVRGFVLGHEGSLDVSFDQSQTVVGREEIEYLLYYAGPHILKNPFGDVYDVTFGSPDFEYVGGGHLNVTLTWIEVGATNNPGLAPDEFLALIGAE